ncbi:DUF4148 domain-containing protein [Paraburkholderia sabiae]|jgi:hypothetical protein|uniref:DUF4148 domain-containing protein n=1 Tax=Paraburkholderia sabiae TaxID=273251 RepID=A0ABU9Q895_9BURK|nr:DUF4148 domain-containing protein [Paraburkholderia sabiae]WJZ77757.1 DUF4148 domain-containing protein [Paraburkholderia sabiae]CAD6532592.1 hypothetical protein LMG24235_02645 [Paraburkholderia sabiae]
MKLQSLVIAALLTLPAVSFAQSSQPLTRAEVRAQLVELQQAGYNAAVDAAQYPKNLLEAEARISAQQYAANSAYGEAAGGQSASGAPAKAREVIGLDSVYARP